MLATAHSAIDWRRPFEMGYGGLGCVIHIDAIIGNDCHLGTHVTIGGNATAFGAPTLGDKVYVGTGAKILGPIAIGDNVIIGANSVVLSDVPAGSMVAGIPAKVIRSNILVDEYLAHKNRDS